MVPGNLLSMDFLKTAMDDLSENPISGKFME